MLTESFPVPVWAMYGLPLLLCLVIACISLCRLKLKPWRIVLFAVLSFLLGVAGAHLMMSLCTFSDTLHYFSNGHFPGYAFLSLWDGRYMMWGGILGVLCALLLCAPKGARLSAADAAAPAGALAIALVRLVQGLLGGYYFKEIPYVDEWETEYDPRFDHFPWSVADEYEELHWALFLAAVLWMAVVLVLILASGKGHAAGDRTLLLIGLYGAGQVVLESMRRDEVIKWGFIRCSQLFAAIAVLIVLLCYWKRAHGRHRVLRISALVLYFLSTGVCLVMEFATEQRIAFLAETLSSNMCYAVSALGCVGLVASIYLMRSAEKE